MKETIIKSVTAVICVIAVCVSSVLAIGKYGDAMVETAKHTPAAAASTSGGGSSATGGSTSGGATADPSATPDATTPDASAADPSATPDASTPSSGSSTGTSTGGSASTGGSSATSTDPTKYSKAQIVAYYNNAIKATAKAPKLSVTKKENITIKVDTMKPDSDLIMNFVNKYVLEKYAKTSTYSMSFVNGVSSDKTKAIDYLPKAQLQAAGAKSASITKSGSNYVVTIVTVAEKATLQNPKPKYASQCAAPLDISNVDLGPIAVTRADIEYPGITLKATVGANGMLVNSSIDQPLKGAGTADIKVYKPEATCHGAWTQKNTYKY